jgi:hypothetical protein
MDVFDVSLFFLDFFPLTFLSPHQIIDFGLCHLLVHKYERPHCGKTLRESY